MKDDRCDFFSYGDRCPVRKINTSKHFCAYHCELEVKKPTPLLCPICTDTKSANQIKFFNCSHFVCKKCFSLLRDLVCPICRTSIVDVMSRATHNRIKNRIKKDKDDRADAQLREYLENNQEFEVLDVPLIPVYSPNRDVLGFMFDVIDEIFDYLPRRLG